MKLKGFLFRFAMAIFSSCTVSFICVGQGIDIESSPKGNLFVGFSVTPAISGISNDFGSSEIKPDQTQNTTLSGKIEAGFMFSDVLGLSTGIGYNSYSTELSLVSYSAMVSAIDSDNDLYERNINGKGIRENQKIGYLSIPLLLNLDINLTSRTGIEFQPGLNLNIPINKKYTSEGVFDYTGYYSSYNITFEKIPYEDFSTDMQVRGNDNLILKSFSPEVTISGNIYMRISSGMMLYAGAIFNKMISDISGYDAKNDYVISAKPSEMNSMMEGSSKVTAQALGFKLGIRYLLK